MSVNTVKHDQNKEQKKQREPCLATQKRAEAEGAHTVSIAATDQNEHHFHKTEAFRAKQRHPRQLQCIPGTSQVEDQFFAFFQRASEKRGVSIVVYFAHRERKSAPEQSKQ